MPSLRSRCIKGGHLALVLLGSVVVAQAQESPGSQPGGRSGGTQGAQERMYQERIKELGANQPQQGTKSQDSETARAMDSQPVGSGTVESGSSGTFQGGMSPASPNKRGGK